MTEVSKQLKRSKKANLANKTNKVNKKSKESNIKAIQNRMNEHRDWLKWGQKLVDEQRLDDALKSFDHAIQIDPLNAEAYYLKGKCLVWLDRGDEGIKCFKAAMNIKALENTSEDKKDLYLKQIQKENIDIYNSEKDERLEKKGNTFIEYLKSNLEVEQKNPLKMLDFGSKVRSRSSLNDNMGMDLKDRLERINESESNQYLKSQSDELIDNDHSSRTADIEVTGNDQDNEIEDNNTNDLNNQFKPPQIETQVLPVESDLFPVEGGTLKSGKSLLKELIKYQQTEIHNVVEYLLKQHGGCFYYDVEPPYLFRLSVLLLEIVMKEYHMDGVIITVDKPAKYIRKILNNNYSAKYEPLYVDCNTSCYHSYKNSIITGNSQDKTNEFITKDNITYLGNNFNFQELRDAIEINLQKVAELYEGEHHFIFFDNIASFQNYTTDREIKKFIKGFANDLQKLNLYGFFMVPKGVINITLRQAMQNFPDTISNKLGFANKQY